MSIFTVENLTKTYGDKVLFDQISFSISEKQRIGLIGVNGTGKSSLLKFVAGIESAESGSIHHAKDFHLEYLPQDPDLDGSLTVLEQIYYGDSKLMRALREYEQALLELETDGENEAKLKRLMERQQRMDELNAWEANTAAKTILTRLGITNFQQKIAQLSGGQKKRVAIAKALIQPADLLLLDEPTNHLDHETIEWLEVYLAQYPGALLVVTHDRYFLNRITNTMYELDQGHLYAYEGNYEQFLEKKAEREANEAASEDKRQNLLRRELAWLRRGAKARTTKQKARIQRVEELRDRKVKSSGEQIEIQTGSTRLGKKVIELEQVSKSYAGKDLLKDFSYLVTPEQRVGIVGVNGSGKSTLLNLMAGRVQADSGCVVVGETVKIGYYTQENVEMNEDLRVLEYIREVAEVMQTEDGQTITAEQLLERFLFSRSAQWTFIRKLSGGERRRLYLLRILMQQPNVLFLDEPTNDLDIQTLSILEDYLDAFPGVVITVSHDRYFLDRVVDELVAFEPQVGGGSFIRRFTGNYSEYLELRKAEQELEWAQAREEKSKEAGKDQAATKKEEKRRLSYKEQQEWETIEDRISNLEQSIEELGEQILQAGSDSQRVNELFEAQKKAEMDLELAMERWTELSLLVEEIVANKK